jgi:hypothetical protein
MKCLNEMKGKNICRAHDVSLRNPSPPAQKTKKHRKSDPLSFAVPNIASSVIAALPQHPGRDIC